MVTRQCIARLVKTDEAEDGPSVYSFVIDAFHGDHQVVADQDGDLIIIEGMALHSGYRHLTEPEIEFAKKRLTGVLA